MHPALIALDWGSSSFRAYLMAREGAILDEIATQDGISTVALGAYPGTLRRLIRDWLTAGPRTPIVASGMVGSRHGWHEAPYVPCPADLKAIAAHLTVVEAEDLRVHVAPGLMTEGADGEPDVMRGEEVEILGIADAGGGLVVLPGSHSKWALVEAGRVLAFKTFPTGEVFAAIRQYTLVGAFARSAAPKPPGAAFARGVVRGAVAARGDATTGLLGALFAARSLPLMGKLPEDDAGEYLSGVLIGAEIGEARRLYPEGAPGVAGAKALVERYLAALAALAIPAYAAPAGAAARGLHLIAQASGLLD